MSYVARKIARAKWERRSFMGSGEVQADALSCVRTQGNELSFWACELNDRSIRDVVLALSSGFQRSDKIILALVPRAELERAGFRFYRSSGKTPVEDLQSRHLDVRELTAERVSHMARVIAPFIRDRADCCIVFSRRRVLEILKDAVDESRLKLESLGEALRQEVESQLR